MEDQRVSIIVPVYRTEQYLKRCVNSILAQTHSNIEIILVEDGSPDKSPAICDEYLRKDSRVICIHQENKGVSAARNRGIETATGKFIMFVDSDDFIKANMIEGLLSLMEKYDGDIVCGDYIEYKEEKNIAITANNRIEVWNREEAIGNLFYFPNRQIASNGQKFKQLYTVWGKLYKAALFKKLRYPEGAKFAEDMWLIRHLFHNASRVIYTNDIFYFYSQEGESLVRSPFNYNKLNIVRVAKEWLAFIDKNYPNIHEKAFSFYMDSMVNMCTSLVEERGRKPEKYYQKYREIIKRRRREYNHSPWVRKNDKRKAWMISYLPIFAYRFIRQQIRIRAKNKKKY